MQWISLIIIASACTGCAVAGVPTGEEKQAILGGRNAIVLLRLTSEVSGELYLPFKRSLSADNFGLGLGGFKTGGEPKQVFPRYLSDELRQQGWIFFLLEPGTYYLAVRPPRQAGEHSFAYESSFQHARRWRIDVPENARLVYAGTLHLPGIGERLLFEGKRLTSFREGELAVLNEEDLGRNISAKHLADLGTPQTVLMQRHDEKGTIILRTPRRQETK